MLSTIKGNIVAYGILFTTPVLRSKRKVRVGYIELSDVHQTHGNGMTITHPGVKRIYCDPYQIMYKGYICKQLLSLGNEVSLLVAFKNEGSTWYLPKEQ